MGKQADFPNPAQPHGTQAVFAQQHGGIQEIEEIPSLPVVLGSPLLPQGSP